MSGRWFLTIVARNQLYIAAILEARHNNIDSEDAASASQYIGPARFYIEELQDTLDHLQTGGVENLANTWINANKRPEVCRYRMYMMIIIGNKHLTFSDNTIFDAR